MQQDKQTTFGSIHDYLKRVNGETENDLDFKAQMKECRALMSQKNEKKASENQTSVATKKPKRVGKPATPKAAASKSVSTKPEVAKPIASTHTHLLNGLSQRGSPHSFRLVRQKRSPLRSPSRQRLLLHPHFTAHPHQTPWMTCGRQLPSLKPRSRRRSRCGLIQISVISSNC
jgi:hypothetical protein